MRRMLFRKVSVWTELVICAVIATASRIRLDSDSSVAAFSLHSKPTSIRRWVPSPALFSDTKRWSQASSSTFETPDQFKATNLGKSKSLSTSQTMRSDSTPHQRKKRKQQRSYIRKPWSYSFLSVARRKQAERLTRELEEEHFSCGPSQIDDVATWIEGALEIISDYSALGNGKDAERTCRALFEDLSDVPASSFAGVTEAQVRAERRVMHAWCNQLSRQTASGRNVQRRRPASSTDELIKWQGIAEQAEGALQRMERTSRDLTMANGERSTLLDGADYEAVVLALSQTQLVGPGLQVLRSWQRLFGSSDYIERLAPTTRAYTTTMRSILTGPANQWSKMQGIQYTPTEMAHFLWQECRGLHRKTSLESLRPTRVMCNTLLDGWSKVLPPPGGTRNHKKDLRGLRPHKKQGFPSSPLITLSQGLSKETVAKQATLVWESMAVSEKDARSYTLMIYTYCKCDMLDEAFTMWNELLERLLLARQSPKKERVDSRSFRMLVRALALQERKKGESSNSVGARNIQEILLGMWGLCEAGYNDTAPDVYLYTTALNALGSSVKESKAMLEQLETKYRELRWDSLKPDVAVFNALLSSVARQKDLPSAADEAGSIIKWMEREAITNPDVAPDTISYNIVIDACLASKTREGIERADQTLRWMAKEFQTGNRRVKPILRSFSEVILAWTDLSETGVAERAETILDRMEERYRPPGRCYEAVVRSWCSEAASYIATDVSTDLHPAHRAKLLLERMEQVFRATDNENEMMRPSTGLYNAVGGALSKIGNNTGEVDEDIEAVQRARDRMYPPRDSALEPVCFASTHEVFDLLDLLDGGNSRNSMTAANTRNFNAVISRLAKSGNVWAGQRAEDVLNYMLELSLKRGNKNMTPTIVTFNSVIAAWSKSSHPKAGERGHGILGKLETLHKLGFLTDVQADRQTFNTIMNAYAKSPRRDAAVMAEKVFRQMEELYAETKDNGLSPDIVSYSTLLNAWANGRYLDGPRHAEEILLQMQKNHRLDSTKVKPNTHCFNEVIYAYARCRTKRTSKQAEMILNLLEDMEDVRPNRRTYNIVLLALANSGDEESSSRARLILDRMKAGEKQIQPDLVSYSTALSTFTNQASPRTTASVRRVLDEVMESDLQPDSDFFVSLLHTLSRMNVKGTSHMAEDIVNDMARLVSEGKLREIDVNTRVYNALINAHAKSGERGSAARAEAILQELEDKSLCKGKTWLAPDERSYTLVLDAYAKSRDSGTAQRAEAIINGMEDRMQPNAHAYTALIQNYARSDIPSKAARAQSVLQRMKDDYANGNHGAKPTIVSYNAVLNACEFSTGGDAEIEEAFKVACMTLDEMRSRDDLGLDQITYGTFLGVIAALMPKSDMRNEMVELLFRRCCADGMMGSMVLKKLQDAASSSLYSKLLADVKKDELPRQWRRNVVESRR